MFRTPWDSRLLVCVQLLVLAGAVLQVADGQALSPGGPPRCAQTYIADGKTDYNDIANKFFPEATVADPAFGKQVSTTATSSGNSPYNYWCVLVPDLLSCLKV